jgi:protein PhnA
MTTKDSNGAELNDGDSVQVIKDLKVKGTSNTLKRGSLYKNIRLTDNNEEIECGKGKSTIVLKTCFLKKS